MSDGEALLAAIIDHPGEDDRRLVYADWLEEQGQDERAEVIRADDPWPAFVGLYRGLAREMEALLGLKFCGFGRENDDVRLPYLRYAWVESDPIRTEHNFWMVFRRGFVEIVRCPLDAWRKHGQRLAATHPIRRVEITDREPYYGTSVGGKGGWLWMSSARWDGRENRDGRDELPSWLWSVYVALKSRRGNLGRAHPDREDAVDFLSATCLAWAKTEAPVAAG
jgi:uncharacterized protein (TIGR02996 family)